MELREEIARDLYETSPFGPTRMALEKPWEDATEWVKQDWLSIADRILAIPAIRDGERLRELASRPLPSDSIDRAFVAFMERDRENMIDQGRVDPPTIEQTAERMGIHLQAFKYCLRGAIKAALELR